MPKGHKPGCRCTACQPKAHPINIKVPPALLAAIDQQADREDKTRTEWMLDACRLYLHSKGVPK